MNGACSRREIAAAVENHAFHSGRDREKRPGHTYILDHTARYRIISLEIGSRRVFSQILL